MKIEVLTEGFTALPKVIKIIKGHSYKIAQNIQDPQAEPNRTLHTFILSNDGNFQGLVEGITSIRDVIDVTLIERNIEAESFEEYLRQKAQSIVDSYPDFVIALKEIDSNLGAHSLLKVGQYIGEGLVNQGKIQPPQTNRLPRVMNKLILPAFRSFSIAKVKGNELQILANPLCLAKQSDRCRCFVLQGIIQGLLHSVVGMSACTVCETSCKAAGAKKCIFTISPAHHQ